MPLKHEVGVPLLGVDYIEHLGKKSQEFSLTFHLNISLVEGDRQWYDEDKFINSILIKYPQCD